MSLPLHSTAHGNYQVLPSVKQKKPGNATITLEERHVGWESTVCFLAMIIHNPSTCKKKKKISPETLKSYYKIRSKLRILSHESGLGTDEFSNALLKYSSLCMFLSIFRPAYSRQVIYFGADTK